MSSEYSGINILFALQNAVMRISTVQTDQAIYNNMTVIWSRAVRQQQEENDIKLLRCLIKHLRDSSLLRVTAGVFLAFFGSYLDLHWYRVSFKNWRQLL